MKKELNKNYAKPFFPPENITALSYIIYETNPKKKALKKINSNTFEESQYVAEICKIYLHSHQVLVSLNSRTTLEIASLTKIMTCIVAICLAKKFRLCLNSEFITIGLF